MAPTPWEVAKLEKPKNSSDKAAHGCDPALVFLKLFQSEGCAVRGILPLPQSSVNGISERDHNGVMPASWEIYLAVAGARGVCHAFWWYSRGGEGKLETRSLKLE